MGVAEATQPFGDDGRGEQWNRARQPIERIEREANTKPNEDGKYSHFAHSAVFAEVNGEPAIVGISGSTVVGVLVLEVSGDEISAVRAVANPDKLRFAARQAMRLSHLEPLPGLS